MATFFDLMKRSYEDVEITDRGINTSQFLEASESLVSLFGISCDTQLICRPPGINSILSRQERYERKYQGTSMTFRLMGENPRANACTSPEIRDIARTRRQRV